MSTQMLTKAGLHAGMLQTAHSGRPGVTLWGQITLAKGRIHEAMGPSRRFFALQVAAALSGPVIWVRPSWQSEVLNPDGLRPWIDPARLIEVTPSRTLDLLWCAEEILRAGVAPLMVLDLSEPPALTPIRRLHLAAETPHSTSRPIGLLLTPGPEGATGVETRWHLAPTTDAPDMRWSETWQLERHRARAAPPASGHLVSGSGGLTLLGFPNGENIPAGGSISC